MKIDEMDCCSMHDPQKRRGIWFHSEEDDSQITIRAGREGDDYEVVFKVGQVLNRRDIYMLTGALDVGRWMLEEAREKEKP